MNNSEKIFADFVQKIKESAKRQLRVSMETLELKRMKLNFILKLRLKMAKLHYFS